MKRISAIIPLLLLFLFHTFPIHASLIHLRGERLSLRDGLPCNTINSIVQDEDGFMWIATPNGLTRYDGYSFLTFHSFSSDPNRKTNSHLALLFSDNRNRLLWTYTPQHTLYCYDLRKGKFVDYTGRDDCERQYFNRCLTSNGMWLYDTTNGVRHIACDKGTFTIHDYTTANRLLPSQEKMDVDEDARHNIWITTARGVVRIAPNGKRTSIATGKHIKVTTVGPQHFAILTDEGDALIYDLQGRLVRKSHLPSMTGFVGKSRSSMMWNGGWYIFTEQETYCMDMKTGVFSRPAMQIPDAVNKSPIPGYTCLYDKQGNLYLFGAHGWMKKLHLLDKKSYINGRDRIFNVERDKRGRFFIATYGNGLFVYDPHDDTLQHFSSHDKNAVICSNFLLSLYISKDNTIWITSESGIFCLKEEVGYEVKYLKPEPGDDSEWSNFVRHLDIKSPQEVLLSTKENKLYTYNPQTDRISFLDETPACVYAYYKDHNGHSWMGTKGAGVYIDGQRFSISDKAHHVPSNNFYDFFTDRYGRTWMATWESGLLLTPPCGKHADYSRLKFQQLLMRNNSESRIHDLLPTRDGRLWLATNNGVYMVDTRLRHVSDRSFEIFNTYNGLFPADEIICAIAAHDGSLWFGFIGGVARCEYDAVHHKLNYQLYDTNSGLVNNNVRQLCEDRFGYVWVGTEEGMSRIDHRNRQVKTFMLGDDMYGNIFIENCATALPDGRLLLGTVNGLAVVTPQKEPTTMSPYKRAMVTDMTINGVSIYNEKDPSLLSESLSHAERLELPHDKNTLTVYFSSFEYTQRQSTLFQYYLQGVDDTWRPATSVNHADYSDLAPGTYTFHLRTLTGNNQWGEETVLRIIIRQPWYNTWWAWIVYLMVIAAIGYYVYKTGKERMRLNQQMTMEKQITEFRIDFFTHISHEFRTPIAIIQNAVDKLVHSEQTGVPRSTLQTINRGTRRLMRLVNQLMDFRKVSTDNMRLSVQDGDIVAFVKNIYQDLWTLARQKNIMMTFTPHVKSLNLWFDRQKVESIVYNILSNAVKYTPEKGTVSMRMNEHEGMLVITVEDNGPGISAQQEKELFKPFMHGYVSQGGMGIGLYTAHQMAILHKGTLSYHQASAEGGCVFTLEIPTNPTVYSEEERTDHVAIDTSSINTQETDVLVKEMVPQAINNVTVVIIEDDPDMMEQIKSEVSVYFNVRCFLDGKAGYEAVVKEHPALIICDIMLPGMNGYEIASALKSDPATQSIPFIMLTAFDDTSHKLKAYKAFVDDYMVKPCDFKLLVARAFQFIAADKKKCPPTRQQAVAPEPQAEPQPHLLTSAVDQTFKARLALIVSQHISDQEFNVDKLAELMNMGRTKLYNRTKEIMGVSPNIYIQNERLTLSAKLIIQGELSVSEISEKVGFVNPTYFYRCFKAKYGVPPSKYGRE